MERVAEIPKQHEYNSPTTSHAREVFPTPPLSPFIELQQQAGNQAVQQLLRSGFIQAKLAISNPDDLEEREADQVAHAIMRSPSPFYSSAFFRGAPEPGTVEHPIARSRSAFAPSACSCGTGEEMCDECRQKQSPPTIQRHATVPSTPAHVPRIVRDVLRSPGQPLDAFTRSFFEPRFGRDFSDVRVHIDSHAAESARSINANAFTHGNNIVFDSGQYEAYPKSGSSLIAQELTHVVQQSQPNGCSRQVEGSDAPQVLQRQPSQTPNSSPLVPDPPDPGYQESAHAPSYRVRVVAHASPRWKGAQDPKHADQLNLELSQKRADEVGREVERLLTKYLPAGSSVNVHTSTDLQDDTVGVDVEAHGSRDTLHEASGNRADNAQSRRRVDVYVLSNQVVTGTGGASRQLLRRPSASRFWHVSVDLVAGGSVGAAGYLVTLTLTNDNTGETMQGKVWTAGGGPKASLGAQYSLGDSTGFMTKEQLNFQNFEGVWVTYESGGVSLFLGYSWSYLTFWGLQTDPKDINVSAPTAGTVGLGGSVTSGVFHFDGDPPAYPPVTVAIPHTGETDVAYTRTEHGEDKYQVLFATGNEQMNPTELELLDSFLASVTAARK